MWITYFNWFLGILSLAVWGGTYAVYDKYRLKMWFDNKFGKDDPMPPMPKQQTSSLNIEEGQTFNYEKQPDSEQTK